MDEEKERNPVSKDKARRRIWPRVVAWTLAAFAVLFLAIVALLPTILVYIDWPEISVDLSRDMKPEQKKLFTNLTARAKIKLSKSISRDIVAHADGTILDWPFSARVGVDYSLFGLSAEGSANARIDGSPWKLSANFEWSAGGGWTADAKIEETVFDEKDPVLGSLANRAADGNATDIVFAGKLSLDAHASDTNKTGLAFWTATARVTDVAADLKFGNVPVALRNLRLRGGASGIGDHVDIAPMFPRADTLMFNEIPLTNVFASVRATESAWLVTEAGADVCGGKAHLYSLFLNPERLSAGFTLYLDDIETEEVLQRLAGFSGTATGRLHGKLPLRIRDGESVSFGDAYLYSIPGESGTIRMEDATMLVEQLAVAGVAEDARENLAKALRNLDYTVLNINLKRGGDEHALGIKLEGTATSGKTTVPVLFGATLHGNLEQLVNTGLRAAGAGKKGDKK